MGHILKCDAYFTEFCLYNGIVVKQGQVLRMGCDRICRCDDAKSGQINCQDRYSKALLHLMVARNCSYFVFIENNILINFVINHRVAVVT